MYVIHQFVRVTCRVHFVCMRDRGWHACVFISGQGVEYLKREYILCVRVWASHILLCLNVTVFNRSACLCPSQPGLSARALCHAAVVVNTHSGCYATGECGGRRNVGSFLEHCSFNFTDQQTLSLYILSATSSTSICHYVNG